MLSKQITYTDLNGEERTETFLFNLARHEITKLELSITGGLTGKLERLIETRNGEDNEYFRENYSIGLW